MPPDVSIIIPHLNQPDFLRNCLRSLRSQNVSMDNVEIVVVDNGSTQLPTEICREFRNVRLTTEDVPGPGPARNKGINVATSSLLAFIDADCIAASHWLAAILRAFRDPAVDVVGGDVRIAVRDPRRMTAIEAYESVYAYRQEHYIKKQGFSGTGNLAMRRSAFETVGPFGGIGVAEDRDWGQRATASGLRIRFVSEMLVYHPARKTFAELQLKWKRHIAHDYHQQPTKSLGRMIWILKSMALAISPSWEWLAILFSPRLDILLDRLKAFIVMSRIRFFRSSEMITQMRFISSDSVNTWNRQ